ncbi:hypothetical protein L3Q82_001949 [Scortum barcoo]|uniref:Uncharacterized protein n=1 Tax=Scortum barcoo TaxID=214431 RepID=A0ACB8W1N5_9TELE|nr:hypothetical protein L3Q82_001949 [Scortum barcoo]
MFSASIVDGGSKLWTQGLWCLSWWQSPNPVVDTGSKGCRQAEEGVLSDHVGLWDKFLTQLTGTGRPSKPQPGRSWRQKLGSGRSSVKAMEEASKRFWQTVRRLRRGKQYSANTVYSAGGELEEAEAGDSEVDSSITQAEVTEVVRKLLGGKAPGVDEIRPEYLKSLDVVGLSWLTRLCNIAWRLGTVPLEWQTGVVVPLFKKGDRRVCSNYRGITLLSLPGKVYARVLERRIRPIVDPRIQEEQCGFRPGRGTLDQLYTLRRVLEGLWEFAQPVHMCFVDLEKAFDRVPRGILCGSAPLSMGSGAFAKGCSVSVRPEQELGSHCRQVACPLRVSGEVLPQVEEFKYLGVLFTSEGKMEREIDRRIGAASAVMRSVYRTVVVKKKELSRKARLSMVYRSIYVPTLTYGHELWGGVPGVSHREEALGEDPGHAGETMSLGWPGNASGIPPEELEEVSGQLTIKMVFIIHGNLDTNAVCC